MPRQRQFRTTTVRTGRSVARHSLARIQSHELRCAKLAPGRPSLAVPVGFGEVQVSVVPPVAAKGTAPATPVA